MPRKAKKAVKATKFDPAEYLDTPKRIAAYLEAVFEDGDPALIVESVGIVAKARGMSRIALESGLSRESLYRALSGEGRPEFATIAKVVKAMGLRLSVEPA